MGGFVSRPKPPPPPPAPVYAPAPTKAEVSQVSSTDASGMLKGKGRSSTILTGAKGLGDNALTTTKKSLLGG
tara:strand:- start:477 stop:692 length:216 start_codon:yes stop_codon:yes gene_type:complete